MKKCFDCCDHKEVLFESTFVIELSVAWIPAWLGYHRVGWLGFTVIERCKYDLHAACDPIARKFNLAEVPASSKFSKILHEHFGTVLGEFSRLLART